MNKCQKCNKKIADNSTSPKFQICENCIDDLNIEIERRQEIEDLQNPHW